MTNSIKTDVSDLCELLCDETYESCLDLPGDKEIDGFNCIVKKIVKHKSCYNTIKDIKTIIIKDK